MTDLAIKPITDEATAAIASPSTPVQTDAADTVETTTVDEAAASGETVDTDSTAETTELQTPSSDVESDEATAQYAWAPAEPARKKRHLGWWIGVPAGLIAVGVTAASLMLVAPGTSVAGVAIGGLTPGAAADAIQTRLAETTVTLTGTDAAEISAGQLGASVAADDGATTISVTGAELGARVDAQRLADAAFDAHPMWNVAAWNAPAAEATIMLDNQVSTDVLRAAAPSLYSDPVDAQVTFDATSASYVVVPAVPGEGIDIDTVRTALQQAFDAGDKRIEIAATTAPVEARTPSYAAQGTVNQLNGMLDKVGFYLGADRLVPVDRAVAASWITISVGERGAFEYDVDPAAIQSVVDTLPAAVDRVPVNATVITDSDGSVLREETAGVAGRSLDDTTNVAKDFASQLRAGDPVYELSTTETPFTTTTLSRRIEVNLSEQRTYLFENGNVVQSWFISSGLSPNNSSQGSFRIFAHVRLQDMGGPEVGYLTKDVPFVSYYHGDEAFHGTYWHNNFGNPMSHGCINMTFGAAEYVYYWAPIGTEVWVHS